MFDPISNYVVGDAYHIAANYLKATGRLSGDVDIHQPLLDSIVDDFRSGKTNRLILANRAIARFEKINDVLELIP
jgi:hypothetical protein